MMLEIPFLFEGSCALSSNYEPKSPQKEDFPCICQKNVVTLHANYYDNWFKEITNDIVIDDEQQPNMLRVATVFSGIGAPEQALLRLNVPYQTVFACDNGEREIDVDYSHEMEVIRSLPSTEAKRRYVERLYAAKTSKQNFVRRSYLANYEVLNGNYFEDVKLLDGRDFQGEVDLFIGGSPCQSFSAVGARGGFEDTRGTLFYEYCRLVHEIRPKVFIYENVNGVLTHDGGHTWEVMQKAFSDLHYTWQWAILDARNFGIPQGRRRLFVVGFRDAAAGARFHFPNPQPLTYTMQDFLEENTAVGSLQSVDGKLVKVDEAKGQPDDVFYLTPKLLAYVMAPGTKNFMHPNAKIDLPIARALLSTMANHHRSSVNNYVTTNGRVRSLTPREAHRLMGFPDSYKMTLSNAQSYKQAGNSIVVDVMMNIIEQVLYAKKWKYGKKNRKKSEI